MTFRLAAGMIVLLCLGVVGRANAQQMDPAAVAAAWRRVSDAPAELTEVRSQSFQLRDARIADAALATARDAGRPTDVRLAALQALMSYVEPSLTVQMDQLRHPTPTAVLARSIHTRKVVGSQAPSADLPARIGGTIRILGENDPDVVVREAARFLTRELVEVHPEVVTLPAGSVTLSDLCGTRYRITNHTAFDISVRLLTASNSLKRSLRIPAGAAIDVTVVEGGPARLLRGEVELARSESGAACG
jgi:hypothetical protein